MSEQEEKDWKKRYDSARSAVMEMELKLKTMENMLSVLTLEKVQWEQQKVLQEQVISKQLGNSDGVVQQLQDEIRHLKRAFKAAIQKTANDGIIHEKILLEEIRELY